MYEIKTHNIYNECHSINKLMADYPKFQFLRHFINKT